MNRTNIVPDEREAEVYEFGRFRFDAAQRMLFRDGELLPLMPKAAETLHALLKHRGRVVEKAELIRLVWPDCTVEEIGLARNISILRKLLGEDGEAYIETVPKRGYRFAAELPAAVAVGAPTGPKRRQWAWLAAPAALVTAILIIYWQFYLPSRYLARDGRSASLAVMPFETIDRESPQPTDLGLTEILATEITKLDSVLVTSPSTIERYRKARVPVPVMSRVLGLDVIVEGKVENLENSTRIDVRLTDVHSGKVIWADSYHGESKNWADVRAEAARKVTDALRDRLRPPELGNR